MSDLVDSENIEDLKSAFRSAKVAWIIRAVLGLVIGIAVLVWPKSTVSVIAVLLGIYFLVLGVVRIVEAITDKNLNGGGRVANFIIGGLILAAGVVVIRNPFATAAFVVLIIGVTWIFEGIATLVDTARGNGDWISIVIGLLITAAGILVVLFNDGVAVAYAVFFGITLIVVAVLDLVLYFRVNSYLKSVKE
jgi:uncharacterized membrane protein HdeD (DUF308 family)